MSRQFYFYLLPPDVESLVQTLNSRVGISLIQTWSPCAEVVPLRSPILPKRLQLGEGAVRVDCFITPPKGADIRMRFLAKRSIWNVDAESEVIEFRGCEFDGNLLLRGRFYFQNDLLVGDTIVPKRSDFLHWADNVFRLAKKSLRRSKVLDAYLGEQALGWARQGGQFAWTVTPQRGPLYVSATDLSD